MVNSKPLPNCYHTMQTSTFKEHPNLTQYYANCQLLMETPFNADEQDFHLLKQLTLFIDHHQR